MPWRLVCPSSVPRPARTAMLLLSALISVVGRGGLAVTTGRTRKAEQGGAHGGRFEDRPRDRGAPDAPEPPHAPVPDSFRDTSRVRAGAVCPQTYSETARAWTRWARSEGPTRGARGRSRPAASFPNGGSPR